MLFLSLFIVIVYTLFYFVTLHEQEREIRTLAAQELPIIKDYLLRNEKISTPDMNNQGVLVTGQYQFFYYVIDPKGRLILGNEVIHRLRPDLLRFVKGWAPQKNEVHYETLQVSAPAWKDHLHPSEMRKVRFLITGRPIVQGNQFMGTLYIGKDISFRFDLFTWLFVILGGLAILFLGVALFISHLMSKRAMIPIIHAFEKQREFVADASHELRTPLSVMLSSINALEMEKSSEENNFSIKLLSTMKDEVKRMTKLVSNLLTLARSDSGALELLKETFDFTIPAKKAIESFEPLAVSKHITLHLHAPDTLMVYGDSERLSQLLYILLDNAIKYTQDEGEISLSLSVEAHEHHRTLRVMVQDTGIGIHAEECERIFDRFYRSDKSRSRQMGGHGLGLAIAKWIVEAHQGTIEVSSELHQGSTFVVKIPFSI
jgi:signal transduction histidine kinase